eukprot:TRINITY_DN1316_c0_g1_i1.p1 TRINITY_DN1316_c0_g1~~TRINITY_DN1316_c0_g1_i1.p1  ORF type:complete len:122 (+),score=9.99 TRINITY_DN1316_c0_g1_i1:194-559(+)
MDTNRKFFCEPSKSAFNVQMPAKRDRSTNQTNAPENTAERRKAVYENKRESHRRAKGAQYHAAVVNFLKWVLSVCQVHLPNEPHAVEPYFYPDFVRAYDEVIAQTAFLKQFRRAEVFRASF